MLLPAFAPTAGRLRPQAENACAVFRQPHRNGLAAPAQDRLGEPGAAATVFQRHLRLESTPGGTRHLRCREAQVLHLTGRERRLRKWLPETHGKSGSLTRFVARLRDHLGSYHTAVLLFPEITLDELRLRSTGLGAKLPAERDVAHATGNRSRTRPLHARAGS